MKAQGFLPEEMTKLTLVTLVAVILIGLILIGSGSLGKMLDDFCKKNPIWCGYETTEIEDQTSLNSFKALALAINSVASGEPLEGVANETEVETTGSGEPPISGFEGIMGTTESEKPTERKGAYVTCNFREEGPVLVPAPGLWERVKNWFSSFIRDEKKNPYGCTVHNFNLPQKVSKTGAKKWIIGYGDPKYLVYWNSFPAGEDKAWTGYSTWMKNVGTIVLFAIPTGRILATGKKAAVGTIKDIGTSLKVGVKENLANFFRKIFRREADEAIDLFIFFRGGVTEAERIVATETALTTTTKSITLKDAFKKMWGAIGTAYPENELKTLFKVAGVATLPALGAALIDSRNERHIKYPDSLVLKMPYKTPKAVGLQSLNGGIVFLDKESKILELSDSNYVPLYFASPCNADLKVESSPVFCEEYTYSTETGYVGCEFTTIEKACEENSRRASITANRPCSKEMGINYIPKCGNEDKIVEDPMNGYITGTSKSWCFAEGIKVYREEKLGSSPNFCFTRPSPTGELVFLGTLIADGIVTYFSAGLLTQVAVGVTGGVAYVAAQSAENWPGR